MTKEQLSEHILNRKVYIACKNGVIDICDAVAIYAEEVFGEVSDRSPLIIYAEDPRPDLSTKYTIN